MVERPRRCELAWCRIAYRSVNPTPISCINIGRRCCRRSSACFNRRAQPLSSLDHHHPPVLPPVRHAPRHLGSRPERHRCTVFSNHVGYVLTFGNGYNSDHVAFMGFSNSRPPHCALLLSVYSVRTDMQLEKEKSFESQTAMKTKISKLSLEPTSETKTNVDVHFCLLLKLSSRLVRLIRVQTRIIQIIL